MTDDLVERLRTLGRDFDDWDTAAARIEALTAERDALIAQRDAVPFDTDAAKVLHDALHPGVRVKIFGPIGEDWAVHITGIDTVFGPDLARAWLLAILKKLEAEGRG